MQIPARFRFVFLAIPALLIVANAQQMDMVTVRPRVVKSPPGVPSVQIAVDRNRVPVGDQITVILSPANVLTDPRYRVTLDFGDDTPRVTPKPKTIHQYQKPGLYTVRVSVAVAPKPTPIKPDPPVQPQIPGVSLQVGTARPTVGLPLRFAANLTFVDPSISYRFDFGDNSSSGWQTGPVVFHAYSRTGVYSAHVDIGRTIKGAAKKVGESKPQKLDVIPGPQLPGVTLTADPAKGIEEGEIVIFTARIGSRDPNLRFLFNFGDGSKSTGWQSERTTRHRYGVAGDYTASVEAALMINGKIGQSTSGDKRSIGVTRPPRPNASPTPTPLATPTPLVTPSPNESPTPGTTPAATPTETPTTTPGAGTATPTVTTASPNASASPAVTPSPSPTLRGLFGIPGEWWKYILIALVVLFVGYQAFRLVFFPRMTLQAHRDAGVADVEVAGKPLSIDFQMDLDPNIGDAEYGLDTDEPTFIKSERSSDG